MSGTTGRYRTTRHADRVLRAGIRVIGVATVAALLAVWASVPSTATQAPIIITFWSAYSGPLGADLDHLVGQFNASQTQYRVEAVYKGTYPQVLAATIAAFRAHRPPDITMIFDVGTATMMFSQGVYVPVYQLMARNKIPFSTSDFLGAAASYYETADGHLDSLPFASSTPVLYYNKKMLAAVGATPPSTWQGMEAVSKRLLAHGVPFGFTTGWPDWTQFEQYAMWNGYHYATKENGYLGVKGVRLLINTAPFVNHLAQLGRWETQHIFYYDGRESAPEALFLSQKCALYIDSSASYAAISKGATFPFGVAPFPYEATAPGAPYNTVVGGNSLWVMSGAPADVYPGVAQFLKFLMSGPSQAYWASQTGYVAVTKAGVQQLTQEGFYKTHPYSLVAVKELTGKPPTAWTRGVRLGDLPQIRDIENAAMTAVVSGKESAQAALNAAEQQGNRVLEQFASQY
jgi:sn-glycerol 3-phosphate transport system substrate-binding protein